MSERTILKSLDEVAQYFKVHRRTVSHWQSHHTPMPGGDGEWIAEDIAKWRQDTLHRKPEDNHENFSGDQAEDLKTLKLKALAAKVKLDEAKAEQEQRKNELEREAYCKLEDVKSFISQFLAECRNQLMRIPVEAKAAYGNRAEFFQEDTSARFDLHLKHMHHWLQRADELEVK